MPESAVQQHLAERPTMDGVVAVLLTPYVHGTSAVDEATIRLLTRRLEVAGIRTITALGNTAEVHQLTPDERVSVLRAVAAARQEATLIAGLAGSLGGTLEEASRAYDLGYDAVMLHEPAEPFGDGDGIARYFGQICERVALPVVLYVRSTRLSNEALTELVASPSVIAVKYARPDLTTLAALLDGGAAQHCTWINGSAEAKVPAFAELGITAFTSGIANVRPDVALAVHAAAAGGDQVRLRQLIELVAPVEALRNEVHARFNVAVLKELLRAEGIETGGVRPPHSPLTSAATESLRSAVATWPKPDLATPRSSGARGTG
ncbi:dihydrodipicolinate synthase family protein [Actinopolymorpha alba]|uniref:dihydrodipicolinate synthase family protein n=1 Tax=Actinopolymorpha alba TaxID=533267 RepID=UPI001ED990DA|nr:dihydrodipicolinate synthase family protein [Actinopolymorpha alba]